jgi:hypothetical protein
VPDISKIDSGKIELHTKPLDVNLLREALEKSGQSQ